MERDKLKILAIDDNPDNLITLRAIIAEVIPKSEVMTALSGQKGIAMARDYGPDVKNGWEETLKSLETSKGIRYYNIKELERIRISNLFFKEDIYYVGKIGS